MGITDIEIYGCTQSIRKEVEAICDSFKDKRMKNVSNKKKSNSFINLVKLFFIVK